MLTYHPIHDPSHCIFRMLCLLEDIKKSEILWDQIKILDFYVLFPHLIWQISFPQELRDYKNELKKIKPPYENLTSPSRLMFELNVIQEQSVKAMIAKGLIENDTFASGKIRLRKELVPTGIKNSIQKASFRNENWYEFLTRFLTTLQVKGKNGLKDRTGLMEYKYDVV